MELKRGGVSPLQNESSNTYFLFFSYIIYIHIYYTQCRTLHPNLRLAIMWAASPQHMLLKCWTERRYPTCFGDGGLLAWSVGIMAFLQVNHSRKLNIWIILTLEKEVELAIPDAKLEAATAALASARIPQCTDPACPELQTDKESSLDASNYLDPVTGEHFISREVAERVCAKNRYHMVSQRHFHLQHKWSYYTVLRLYTKSSILWWLPEIALGPVADESFILSTDLDLPPGRSDRGSSTGPWTELYPIKSLRPAKLYEVRSFRPTYIAGLGLPLLGLGITLLSLLE